MEIFGNKHENRQKSKKKMAESANKTCYMLCNLIFVSYLQL